MDDGSADAAYQRTYLLRPHLALLAASIGGTLAAAFLLRRQDRNVLRSLVNDAYLRTLVFSIVPVDWRQG